MDCGAMPASGIKRVARVLCTVNIGKWLDTSLQEFKLRISVNT